MILKRIFGYGMLFVTTLMILSWTFIDDRQYPPDVENILVKAGENRHELEKALRYFQMKGDRQMLQAAYFLIMSGRIRKEINWILVSLIIPTLFWL